jgi:hypothetical protein
LIFIIFGSATGYQPLRSAVNASWRVDETYINLRGKWNISIALSTALQDRGFSASAGSRHRRCPGILSQSAIDEFAEVAAQDHAR